jgi:hypothetical protein
LLAAPFTVTRTGPLVAPTGTGTLILASLQVEGAAGKPLKVMVFGPWLAPKLVPVMAMESPAAPEFTERLVIEGVTTKAATLLATALTVTTILAFPAGKLAGTGIAIAVSLHEVGVTLTPPMVTGLKFRTAPKALPVIVMLRPVGPDEGESALIVGVML